MLVVTPRLFSNKVMWKNVPMSLMSREGCYEPPPSLKPVWQSVSLCSSTAVPAAAKADPHHNKPEPHIYCTYRSLPKIFWLNSIFHIMYLFLRFTVLVYIEQDGWLFLNVRYLNRLCIQFMILIVLIKLWREEEPKKFICYLFLVSHL